MKRALMLGGTWFLGRRVAERLAERGDEVLLVHRGSDRSSPEVPGLPASPAWTSPR
ncbi:hypothetical protein [Nonomuraea sp. 10N515B]|uniref:hypothetical protein n=1 Tax=Nonomuraea sp. 10N515B TaxID=3457422 RepID=UPI003FCC7A4C